MRPIVRRLVAAFAAPLFAFATVSGGLIATTAPAIAQSVQQIDAVRNAIQNARLVLPVGPNATQAQANQFINFLNDVRSAFAPIASNYPASLRTNLEASILAMTAAAATGINFAISAAGQGAADAIDAVDQAMIQSLQNQPQPAAQSDLSVPAGDIDTPTRVTAGESFTVSFTIQNVGDGPTDSTSVTGLRFGPSNQLPGGPINPQANQAQGGLPPPPNQAQVNTPSLGAGMSANLQATMQAPNFPGTYYVWVVANATRTVTDQSTTVNDARPSAAIIVELPQPVGQSDLQPTGISSPGTLEPGQPFGVDWILANTGNAAANSSSTTQVRINQSANSASGGTVATVNTPALGAGAQVSQNANLTAPANPGTYYVWIVANANGAVTNESNAGNNAQRSGSFTVQQVQVQRSDLTPVNVSAPSSVVAGGTFDVDWVIANLGNAAANAGSSTQVRLNQSANSPSGGAQASVNTGALGAGAQVAQSATLNAPTTPGTYFVWIVANANGNVTNESDSGNNAARSGSITVTAPQPSGGADLVPQSISAPGTVAPGQSFTATWQVANLGNQNANSSSTTTVRITSSANSASGTNLASVNTVALAAGVAVNQSATITAPTAPGTYYVWVIANNNGAVTNETNAGNNAQRSASFTVQAPAPTGRADLLPQSVSTPGTLNPGQGFNASWSIVNVGTAAANAQSTTAVRISQSATSPGSNTLATVNTGALAAGGSVTQTAGLNAPTNPGTYYVWVVANANGGVTNEADAANNAQRSGSFTVQAPQPVTRSDLTPQNVSAPASIGPGQPLNVTWTVANLGDAAANAQSTTVVRITSSATSASGTNLATVTTGALGAGAAVGQSAGLTAPTTAGTYYVWVVVNNNGAVTNESNTGNNAQRSAAIVVQSGVKQPTPVPPPPGSPPPVQGTQAQIDMLKLQLAAEAEADAPLFRQLIEQVVALYGGGVGVSGDPNDTMALPVQPLTLPSANDVKARNSAIAAAEAANPVAPPVTVVQRTDGQIVLQRGSQLYVEHEENRLTNGTNAFFVSQEAGGLTEIAIKRPGGAIITQTVDINSAVLARARQLPGGGPLTLIDDIADAGRAGRFDYGAVLPPLVTGIPDGQYIVEQASATSLDLIRALAAPPVEYVERDYTLGEVLANQRLRAKMRRIDLPVTFASGSATVALDQVRLLADLGLALRLIIEENPTAVFLVEGHSDAPGNETLNLTLSDQRADAVARILTEFYDVPAENLVTRGYGEQFLKIPTLNAESRNRRVTILRISPLFTATVL